MPLSDWVGPTFGFAGTISTAIIGVIANRRAQNRQDKSLPAKIRENLKLAEEVNQAKAVDAPIENIERLLNSQLKTLEKHGKSALERSFSWPNIMLLMLSIAMLVPLLVWLYPPRVSWTGLAFWGVYAVLVLLVIGTLMVLVDQKSETDDEEEPTN